jgi:hypothetical protein
MTYTTHKQVFCVKNIFQTRSSTYDAERVVSGVLLQKSSSKLKNWKVKGKVWTECFCDSRH